MCENYTVLTLKRRNGDSFQVLAVCLLSTLFSIAILAKYKITESMTYSRCQTFQWHLLYNQLLCTYQRDYIVTCHVSNRSCGLYRMLPQLSLSLWKLFHLVKSSVSHISSRVNLYLHRRNRIFHVKYCIAPHVYTCVEVKL